MWDKEVLNNVAKIYTGVGFPKKFQGRSKGKYPFYKVGDISKNVQKGNYRLPNCENFINEEDLNSLKGKLIPEGTVVFAKIGEALKLNRRGIINQPSLIDNNAIGVKANEEVILDKFMFYFWQEIKLEQYSRATTVPSVRKSDIELISVPVPPLPTQHRIVEKIEELFSELDYGVESLKKAQKQLKTYRQAVLKDAFEGKLTKKWRERQTGLPTPEELLQQIKAERKAHRERQLAEWEKEVEQWEKNGKPGRKPRKPRKNYKPLPIEESNLVIPVNWIETRLCLLCSDITDGDHQAPPKSDSGFPFITISNINDRHKIDFSDTFFVGKDYFDSLKYERKPQKGDVLFTVTGSFGIPVLVDFDKQFCFQRHIGLLRSFSFIDERLLYYLMQTPNVMQQAKRDATGTAQKTVSLTSLRQFIVPFMSLKEQNQIVNEIESRLSVVDQLEQTIRESLQKAEALRQSILKKAFNGELVENK